MRTLTHAEHLALYSAFHRSHVNRALHVVAQAGVLFSGACLAVRFFWPALAVVVALQFFASVRLHVVGGLATTMSSLMLSALAVLASHYLPTFALVAGAVVIHLISWWALVVVGHEKLEPTLDTPEGAQDSNYYFRHQLYLARNLGFPTGLLDAWTQFAIAPMSSAWDVLEALGVRNPDEEEISALREVVLQRIANGLTPFDAHVAHEVRA